MKTVRFPPGFLFAHQYFLIVIFVIHLRVNHTLKDTESVIISDSRETKKQTLGLVRSL